MLTLRVILLASGPPACCASQAGHYFLSSVVRKARRKQAWARARAIHWRYDSAMPDYRRAHVPGGTYFFTVNIYWRQAFSPMRMCTRPCAKRSGRFV